MGTCDYCGQPLTQWEIDRDIDICNECQADPPIEVAYWQGAMQEV